tara:strand:- start:1733 stop:2041 length:309 start_codon:yes stop_codon:yes gene_type:complete
MSFDEHDGSPNEIKTLYHNKTKKEMVKMMNLLQDMNEHLVLSLVQIDPTSTYEDIIRVDDSEMYFMDSKANWNNGKTYEELKEEAFEEMIMGSVLNGDMGFA